MMWRGKSLNKTIFFGKLDLSAVRLLTTIYDNQQRLCKSESEISKVLEAWESRQPENLRMTLILVKENYLVGC